MKYAAIALKSQTKENFEIALSVLNYLIYFANLLELINKCLDKSLITEALLAFSYVVEMKKTLDSLTTKRLVTKLIESGELSHLDYVMKHSTMSDVLLMKIAQLYIISGRTPSYFTLFDSCINAHLCCLHQNLYQKSYVPSYMRDFVDIRAERALLMKNMNPWGKYLKALNHIIEKLQQRDGLTSQDIESLESYFSYMQLYQIESESIILPRVRLSSMISEALSILPVFEPSSLPFVLEDRNLPRSNNIDRKSLEINDLTNELAERRGNNGPFLLYSRDIFQEDYDKEVSSLSKQSNTAQIVKNIVSMVATYPQTFGNSLSVIATTDPDDEVGLSLRHQLLNKLV